jgi:hypothetical protein
LAYDWAENGINLKFSSEEEITHILPHLPEGWVVPTVPVG